MTRSASHKKIIEELLYRSVDRIYPSREALHKALTAGKRLKVYHGADPTGPHLHLGHLTNLLVLKRFQALGHEIIFLIGDFTARIGDPSDKTAARRPLSTGEIRSNLKTFKAQAGRVVRFSGANAASIKFNSAWLEKLTLADFLRIAALITHSQLIERDMFQARIKARRDIYVHELMYPILQGYDSAAMNVDLEIGGTDQTFNMLMGRKLTRVLKNKEKFVLTTKLLEHPKSGTKLMSKSEGGMINLDDSPRDLFGKVMALDDVTMFPVAEFSTEVPLTRLHAIKKAVAAKKMNPRDAKLEVAEWVVRTLHGLAVARRERENFKKLFSRREVPRDLPELRVPPGTTPTLLVFRSGVVTSRSEARRLVGQGALEIDGSVWRSPNATFELHDGQIVRIGKRHFFRVKVIH